jgi:hypothetical protein
LFAIVRKSIDSRICKFHRFFAEDSLALEALVDSLALKMRIRMTLSPYAIGFHPGLAETVPLTSFAEELIFLEKRRILPLILLEEPLSG